MVGCWRAHPSGRAPRHHAVEAAHARWDPTQPPPRGPGVQPRPPRPGRGPDPWVRPLAGRACPGAPRRAPLPGVRTPRLDRARHAGGPRRPPCRGPRTRVRAVQPRADLHGLPRAQVGVGSASSGRRSGGGGGLRVSGRGAPSGARGMRRFSRDSQNASGGPESPETSPPTYVLPKGAA